jgi:hypothetical protein
MSGGKNHIFLVCGSLITMAMILGCNITAATQPVPATMANGAPSVQETETFTPTVTSTGTSAASTVSTDPTADSTTQFTATLDPGSTSTNTPTATATLISLSTTAPLATVDSTILLIAPSATPTKTAIILPSVSTKTIAVAPLSPGKHFVTNTPAPGMITSLTLVASEPVIHGSCSAAVTEHIVVTISADGPTTVTGEYFWYFNGNVYQTDPPMSLFKFTAAGDHQWETDLPLSKGCGTYAWELRTVSPNVMSAKATYKLVTP